MKPLSLPLAIALGILAQQAGAAGFVDDSKATLGLRNFYINQDTRNADANTQEEWGQGFLFNYTSGFTEAPLGLASMLWGWPGSSSTRARAVTATLTPASTPAASSPPMKTAALPMSSPASA